MIKHEALDNHLFLLNQSVHLADILPRLFELFITKLAIAIQIFFEGFLRLTLGEE